MTPTTVQKEKDNVQTLDDILYSGAFCLEANINYIIPAKGLMKEILEDDQLPHGEKIEKRLIASVGIAVALMAIFKEMYYTEGSVALGTTKPYTFTNDQLLKKFSFQNAHSYFLKLGRAALIDHTLPFDTTTFKADSLIERLVYGDLPHEELTRFNPRKQLADCKSNVSAFFTNLTKPKSDCGSVTEQKSRQNGPG